MRRANEYPRIGTVVLGGTVAIFAYVASESFLATILSLFAGMVVALVLWYFDRFLDEMQAIRSALERRRNDDDISSDR